MAIDRAFYAAMAADPSCTLEDAIMHWASENVEAAEWFTEDYCSVSIPMDECMLKDYLRATPPLELFFMGVRSASMFDLDGEYFDVIDDAYVRSLPDSETDQMFLENFELAALPDILDGDLEPPDEVAEIMEIWELAERGLMFRDENRRCRR